MHLSANFFQTLWPRDAKRELAPVENRSPLHLLAQVAVTNKPVSTTLTFIVNLAEELTRDGFQPAQIAFRLFAP